MGEENKSSEFLAKFPLGKVPVFEGADGLTLFENSAITQYGTLFSRMTEVVMSILVIPGEALLAQPGARSHVEAGSARARLRRGNRADTSVSELLI